MATILFFAEKDPYYEFSNFCPLKKPLAYRGKTFATSEHLYQWMKYPPDSDYAEQIRTINTAYKSKLLAGKTFLSRYPWQIALHSTIRSADVEQRSDWDRVSAMRIVLRVKYEQDKKFRKLLLGTGEAILCENSPHDYFWGIGRKGTGKNMLGKLLMELREEMCRSQ